MNEIKRVKAEIIKNVMFLPRKKLGCNRYIYNFLPFRRKGVDFRVFKSRKKCSLTYQISYLIPWFNSMNWYYNGFCTILKQHLYCRLSIGKNPTLLKKSTSTIFERPFANHLFIEFYNTEVAICHCLLHQRQHCFRLSVMQTEF